MSSAEVHIQAKAHVAGALNAFPTKWGPEVQTNQEDFNKILRELGRVTVAYNRLDQEIFDALSFLLAGPNPATADYAIAAKATNAVKGFEARRNLILSIYEERKPVPAKRQELDQILKACVAQHDNRNIFLHSRWALPEKGSTAAAVRAKFQQGKDKYEDVTLGQLEKLVRDIEECTTRLRDFFSEGAAFSDYSQWIANRVFD